MQRLDAKGVKVIVLEVGHQQTTARDLLSQPRPSLNQSKLGITFNQNQ